MSTETIKSAEKGKAENPVGGPEKIKLIYFSGPLETTKRFIEKLDEEIFEAERIHLRKGDPRLTVDTPYLLVLPTYGAGKEDRAVPKQVVEFLKSRPEHLANLKGLIGAGNRFTYGENFIRAAKDLSKLLNVPIVAFFELLGTPEEVLEVTEKAQAYWEILKEKGSLT